MTIESFHLTSKLWTDSPELSRQPCEQRTGKFITPAHGEAGAARVSKQEEVNSAGQHVSSSL